MPTDDIDLDFYRDDKTSGLRIIGIGVVILIGVYVANGAVDEEKFGGLVRDVTYGSATILGLAFWFFGFYKALKEKGYSGVLTILGLAGILGLIILAFMPKVKAIENDENL